MRKTCIVVCAFVALVSQNAFSLPAKFGLAPDNNLGLLLSTINGAKKSLTINIYQFDEDVVADALVAQIQNGVTLKLLLEGEPLGQISPNGKLVMDRIRKAIAKSSNKKSKFYLMSSVNGNISTRRYRYDHAKYVIADSVNVLIISENFTAHGHAEAGTVGNRGWATELEDPALAKELDDIFTTDSDTRHGDVKAINLRTKIPDLSTTKPEPEKPEARPVPAIEAGEGDVRSAQLISSPNSLEGLLDLIKSAKSEIEVEHMSLPSTWRDENYEKQPSPLIKELVLAAQRGVKVRVLLNDESAFAQGQEVDTSTKPNSVTVNLLNDYHRCYKLPIEGKIVDIKAVGISYIHNKGMIVDGARALVSSINGTKNSIMNNREIAVRLESRDAAQYFLNAFDFDWKKSHESPVPADTCPAMP